VIEGLIPERSLGLLVGDSGLGKTPLAYQMAMCVAAGIPFLGAAVQKGRVLYLDFENGLQDVNGTLARLAAHLGLPAAPDDLVLWNINDCATGWTGLKGFDMIRDVKPLLAFTDPLSGMSPEVEERNSDATKIYQAFRQVIRACGCSIVNLHHRKKPMSPRPGQSVIVQSIEDDSFRSWFLQARGAGVLVNGADIRLGVDLPGTSNVANSDVALVVRGYGRVRGEIPTLHLGRVFDQEGEAVGYRKVSGIQLLCNSEQEAAFATLADRFAFKDAKRTYGKADQPTTDFLKKCIAKGILRKVAKGQYEKVKVAE
jgi:hypothetical protein